jgi:hypothetical protein
MHEPFYRFSCIFETAQASHVIVLLGNKQVGFRIIAGTASRQVRKERDGTVKVLFRIASSV